MSTRSSLLAVSVLLALGASGQAWCDQNERGPGDNNAVYNAGHNGNNRDNQTATSSFNTSNAVATTNLVGYVSGNAIHDIGNYSRNSGDASGGRGGSANGGDAMGGKAIGGDGADAQAISARRGGSYADGVSDADSDADSLADSSDSAAMARARRGGAHAENYPYSESAAASRARARNSSSSSNSGSSGDAYAWGGNGGRARGGSAYADGGTGGAGGDGGSTYSDAGGFDMHNAMNGSANAAAGVMVVAQNSGAASLIQQGVTVQANLAVGR